MPEANATIGTGTRNAQRMTRAKTDELNNNFVFTGNANLRHVPQFYVGIFNVSDMEQKIERPWVHHTKQGKIILVPACEEGQPYGRPFLIPDIVQMPEERPGSWELGSRGVDGRFLAQDAVNPEDPTGSWKTVQDVSAGKAMNEGTNLYRVGCFWITAPTVALLMPTDEEIAKANERLETTYNRLISEADMLFLQGAEGVKQIGPMHRRALNHFGESREWNKRYTRKIACPGCGEPVNAAASVHKCADGLVAVINWEGALRSGAKTIADAVAAGVMERQAEEMADPPKRKGTH